MNQTPDHEDEVSLPLNLGKGLWESELVDKGTEVDEETGESHSLGAHLEGEDLDGVESLKWGPSEGVDRLEDVDHGDHGNGGRHVLDSVWILWIRVLLVLNTSSCDDTDPANGTTEVDPDEHGATTDFVDEARSGGGDDDLDNVHSDEKIGLENRVGDTGSLQDTVQEIRDNTVSSPLTKETSETVGSETIAGSTGLEERSVIPPSLVGTLEFQVRFVLKHLKLDPLGVWVTVAVILGEERFCEILLSVGVVPSRGFWKEHGADEDESREHHLEPNWNDP